MKKNVPEIYPDEIFMDSKNIPEFDTSRFEGRIEKPINKKSLSGVAIVFIVIGVLFSVKIFNLQILNGGAYAQRSENNTLRKDFIIANRGIIYDRNGVKLAWNGSDARLYAGFYGLSHVLGYVGLPSEKDVAANGKILLEAPLGREGVEKSYNDILGGEPGIKIVETDSQNNIVSESTQKNPEKGEDINLAIDSRVQEQFFKIMQSVAEERRFGGGAGIIIDVENGDLLSLISYPEYSSQILSQGEPKEKIDEYIINPQKPFLNRAVSGLYSPGSIIKPVMALAALNEGVISPDKQIYSSGSISLPNPFFPELKSVFRDWKAHGWVDMRRAIAVSSDVYFYEIGGGFEGLKGLGIKKIGEYVGRIGLGKITGIDLFGEEEGLVPSPEWKEKNSPDDPAWRIGDTYNVSIGQGAYQVTPMQMAVMAAALANNGKILEPGLVSGEMDLVEDIGIPEDYFKIVKEGMRMAVTEGTASALSVPYVRVAAKTGTAELGVYKKHVNSWIIGFFPYEKPKYAFAVVMEEGPAENTVGALFVMRQLLDWMSIHAPEYLAG